MNRLIGKLQNKRTLQGGMVRSNGIYDYNDLPNKPQINGVELIGDKNASELNLQIRMNRVTNIEIDSMFKEEN